MVNPFRKYMDVREIRRKERERIKLLERQYWLNEINKIKEAARLQHEEEKYDMRAEANKIINKYKREINDLHRQLNKNRQALDVTRKLTVDVFARIGAFKDFIGIQNQKSLQDFKEINAISEGVASTLRSIATYSDTFDRLMGTEDLKKIEEIEE